MILKNFIVFEGIDGAGTSTQIKKICERNPQKFFQTAEPTSLETGKFLRRMLGGEFSVDEKTNSFLFAADRAEHLYGKNGIIEQINNGKTVISDRYLFSSLAYQSISCGEELPKLLNSTFPLPEILFFFEIDPEISLKRVDSRNEKKEIYEKIETQKKIALEYEKIISEYENNKSCTMKIIRIDATKSMEEISETISKIILQ
ncbi:MAG: dTMP kinase [Spirochaetales bacterium]|nr:dTMP kinase [Spirochaetales bacterium]MDY5915861.1 dTMP kinase [Treponema sp.]